MMSDPVMSYASYRNNSHLLATAADMWVRPGWTVLDPTYGLGNFYKKWRPPLLVAHDLHHAKAPNGQVDFRHLPYRCDSFDLVIFDPPFKLNGQPDPELDERYGVDERQTWRQRMTLCFEGITECARVADKMLMVKCQDQVVSQHVRWQTFEFTQHAMDLGWDLVDRFDMLRYRSQGERVKKHSPCKGQGCAGCDEGRVPSIQAHSARNSSSLLVFEKAVRARLGAPKGRGGTP